MADTNTRDTLDALIHLEEWVNKDPSYRRFSVNFRSGWSVTLVNKRKRTGWIITSQVGFTLSQAVEAALEAAAS